MLEDRFVTVAIGKTSDLSDETKEAMVDQSLINILGYTEEDLGKIQFSIKSSWIDEDEDKIRDTQKYKEEAKVAQEILTHLEESRKSMRNLQSTIRSYYTQDVA